MKIDLKNIKKILIIQYQPFGDVLLNTGYLPALHEKFPDAKIDFLVRKPYHIVLENNPFLDELVTFEAKKGIQYLFERIKVIRRIRKQKYDLVIDQMRGTGSGQITFFSGANYRLGFTTSRYRFAYNIKAKQQQERYSASLKFDLLAPLGIVERPYKLFYHIATESIEYVNDWLSQEDLQDKQLICISPGSPVSKKKWNSLNYAKLADLIIENTNYKIILLWGPQEKADVDSVKSQMKYKPIIAPATNFNQAAALLKHCKLLICNDGGLNHLSFAVETSSLAIFGNTKPINWSPLGHYYLYNENFNADTNNTFGISAEMAFEKAKMILDTINQ